MIVLYIVELDQIATISINRFQWGYADNEPYPKTSTGYEVQSTFPITSWDDLSNYTVIILGVG